ncbi:MAG TPA: winged helix-turn-helix domain-containing protein [Stellaceae bacterium]|nr:winged helix-turn-helix domain-containing protein [Stellaceae bacterium]
MRWRLESIEEATLSSTAEGSLEFVFDDYRLDVDRRELRHGAELIALEPQVFDLLVYLVRNRQRVVSKDELLAAVWGGRIVSESTLSSRIAGMRKAVGDSGKGQRLIRTMPRKGIRFVGAVQEQPGPRRSSETLPTAMANQGSAGLPLPDKPSIAVLPFENMSGDPDQDYFADGIVEELTTALSRIRWLFVIARNSSFVYKGRAVDVRQVGRDLGVRYVLEGSVRKVGDRVRISGQLIEAASGSHLWAERYDHRIADVFAVQDEITERVVAAIEPQLYAAEHFRSRRKPPESLDAWECVIRALSHMGQGTRASDAEAETLCRRAIAISPGYGQAHSLLAWVLIRRAALAGDPIKAVLPEARAEAQTALRLDQGDSWAHVTHGMVLWRNRRHHEASRAFRRALDLNANFALAHALLGVALAAEGMHEDAIMSAARALRLSPIDRLVDFYATRAMQYGHFGIGNYAESLAWGRRLIEGYPEYIPGHTWLAAIAGLQGDLATARSTVSTLLRLRPHFSLTWMHENLPFSDDILDRLLIGLRNAGLPEA